MLTFWEFILFIILKSYESLWNIANIQTVSDTIRQDEPQLADWHANFSKYLQLNT